MPMIALLRDRLLRQPGGFEGLALVCPESLPHEESSHNVRHSAEGSRYRRTATSACEMKCPEHQDFGGGELAYVLDLDPRHSKRLAKCRGQLEHFLAPAIDALCRGSEPDLVVPLHVGRESASDLVVSSALAPELPGPPRKFHVLPRHHHRPVSPRLGAPGTNFSPHG
jgi:hypothetical protein